MTRPFYVDDPAAQVEDAFRRIQAERMADLPLSNPALAVAALGFVRREGEHGDEWRGALLTPWGISLLLLPASADWPPAAEHTRVYRQYAAGHFVFLGNREDGLGDYLFCPLIHDMRQFADQETAVLTARACLIALDMPSPAQAAAAPAAPPPDVSNSRRKFLALGS